MFKIDYLTKKEEVVWAYIPNTNERYKMFSNDVVIDMQPEKMDFNTSWTVEEETREVSIGPSTAQIVRYVDADGKQTHKTLNSLKKITFPELYPSQEAIDEIKQRIYKNTTSITYDLPTFNKLIYPNKLLYILDKTQNGSKWRKPRHVDINDDYTFTLFKGHEYIGVGLTHLIHFDNLFPVNNKPYVEWEHKERRRMKTDPSRRKITSIY